MILDNIEGARSQMQGADDYSVKQLEKYVRDMESQLVVVDSTKEYTCEDEYEDR